MHDCGGPMHMHRCHSIFRGDLNRVKENENGKYPSDPPLQPCISVPAREDSGLQGVQQLKLDLLERLDTQHAGFLEEVKSLREDLLSRLQQELQTLRHDGNFNPNGSKKESPSLPARSPSGMSHGKGNPVVNHRDAPNSQNTPSSEGQAGFRYASRESKSVLGSSPAESPEEVQKGPGNSKFQKQTTFNAISKAMNEFSMRPNLRAFMHAKNWHPEDYAKIVEAENRGNGTDGCFRSKIRKIVEHNLFELVIGIAIIVNAVVMAIALEYDGTKSAKAIGIPDDGGDWPAAESAFMVLEHVFTIFFFLELLLKLVLYGPHFFKVKMNCLDFLIVVAAIFETYVVAMMDLNGGPNLSFMRLIRIVKMIKVLRVVRVLEAFAQLRVMMVAIVYSFPALAWSMVLLSLVQVIAAIFMTQSLQTWLQDEANDQEIRELIYKDFGSFSRSFMSMFELTLAPGTLGRSCRIITYQVHGAYWLFFIGYVASISFAMIRVIAAIFLKETLNAAARDNEMVVAEVNRNPKFIRDVKKVFDELDADGDGHISMLELDALLVDGRSMVFLQALGINPSAASGLFALMDDGDDQITFAEFLSGVMRLKCIGGGVDLPTLLLEHKRILAKILSMEKIFRSFSGVGEGWQ